MFDTEADWLAETDPLELAGAIGPLPHRLYGLLMAAWSRSLPSGEARGSPLDRYLDAAERLADASAILHGRALRRYLAALRHRQPSASRDAEVRVAAFCEYGGFSAQLEQLVAFGLDRRALRCRLAMIARDVTGNPFRSVTFDARWHTPDARALAKVAFQKRDFGVLLILADALEDAGCDARELLDHLRSGSRHGRGCWALDLALGRR